MHKEEYIKIVNMISLESNEYEGSHTLFQHCGRTASELKSRLKERKTPIATSFFNDRTEILNMMQEILLSEDNSNAVLEWLNNPSCGTNLILQLPYDKVIGYGYSSMGWHDWKMGAFACTMCCVVLKKIERRYDTVFSVITAYPRMPLGSKIQYTSTSQR